MKDVIYRQDAIDSVQRIGRLATLTDNDAVIRMSAVEYVLYNLPSAQPDMPEWAQKIEEYRKSAPSHIHNPLAWALYQTWKEYDK